jgi:UDP-N-acetylmuramyl pentapeptide phosphotransferase/UDP-N-acetylglucosamine-1-phosphate transferase
MNNISISASSATIEQIFMLAFVSFLASMILTPLYTTAAFSGKWWKQSRTKTVTGEQARVYQKLHAAKHRSNIPTMAGIIFVLAITLVTLTGNLSRSETWLPLAAMAGAGLIGWWTTSSMSAASAAISPACALK